MGGKKSSPAPAPATNPTTYVVPKGSQDTKTTPTAADQQRAETNTAPGLLASQTEDEQKKQAAVLTG